MADKNFASLYLEQVIEGDSCGKDQMEVQEELQYSSHKRSDLHLLLQKKWPKKEAIKCIESCMNRNKSKVFYWTNMVWKLQESIEVKHRNDEGRIIRPLNSLVIDLA